MLPANKVMAIPAKMKAAPPITWSSPIARASFSSFSTPFCSDTTAVPSPTSGPSRAAAASSAIPGTMAAAAAARGTTVVARLEEIDTVLAHGLGDDDLHALASHAPRVLDVRDQEAA